MTSYRKCFVCAVLSIAGTAGLVSFSNPAAAAPTREVRQATVVTADLNLAAPAGKATFERRVAAAADRVCSQPSRDAADEEATCRRNALAQARVDAGIAYVASN